jgi:hypothetical protein
MYAGLKIITHRGTEIKEIGEFNMIYNAYYFSGPSGIQIPLTLCNSIFLNSLFSFYSISPSVSLCVTNKLEVL